MVVLISKLGEGRSSHQFLNKAKKENGQALSSRGRKEGKNEDRKGANFAKKSIFKEKWQTGRCVCIFTPVKAPSWSRSSDAHDSLCSFPAGVAYNLILFLLSAATSWPALTERQEQAVPSVQCTE